MNRRDSRTKQVKFGVEPLEGRMVLSTAGVSPVGDRLMQGFHYLQIQGTASGSIEHPRSNPDTGPAVVLLGRARLKGLGPELVTGKLAGTGFIARGNLGGEITLSNARGHVTLRLEGPSAAGNTPPKSGTYRFVVESGTGDYAHDLGSGTVRVIVGPKTFRLTFRGNPNNV